jgi:hypothetical protein
MRRTIHWDFDNNISSHWVSCILEVEITPDEYDPFNLNDFYVAGCLELIAVTVTAIVGYDDIGQQRYRFLTRGEVPADWLADLDRAVYNKILNEIEIGGFVADELWSYV